MLLTFNFFLFQTIKYWINLLQSFWKIKGMLSSLLKAKFKDHQCSIYLQFLFSQMLYMQLNAISSLFLYSNAINEKF